MHVGSIHHHLHITYRQGRINFPLLSFRRVPLLRGPLRAFLTLSHCAKRAPGRPLIHVMQESCEKPPSISTHVSNTSSKLVYKETKKDIHLAQCLTCELEMTKLRAQVGVVLRDKSRQPVRLLRKSGSPKLARRRLEKRFGALEL